MERKEEKIQEIQELIEEKNEKIEELEELKESLTRESNVIEKKVLYFFGDTVDTIDFEAKQIKDYAIAIESLTAEYRDGQGCTGVYEDSLPQEIFNYHCDDDYSIVCIDNEIENCEKEIEEQLEFRKKESSDFDKRRLEIYQDFAKKLYEEKIAGSDMCVTVDYGKKEGFDIEYAFNHKEPCDMSYDVYSFTHYTNSYKIDLEDIEREIGGLECEVEELESNLQELGG